MGSINQLLFVEQHRSRFKGPWLEVSSKDYGDVDRIRTLFRGEDFTGIDMLDMPGYKEGS